MNETLPTRPEPSQARLDANRRNARLSTGPRTTAGKNRSRLNATRHGLTAQITVMPDHEREHHDRFINDFLKDLAPQNALETQLALAIAQDTWRLNRIRAMEENMFALGLHEQHSSSEFMASRGHDHSLSPDDPRHDPRIASAFAAVKTFRDDGKHFQLLSLYEQRISRNLHNNLKALRALQSDRQKADKPKQTKPEPARAGFVSPNAPTHQPSRVIPMSDLSNKPPVGSLPVNYRL